MQSWISLLLVDMVEEFNEWQNEGIHVHSCFRWLLSYYPDRPHAGVMIVTAQMNHWPKYPLKNISYEDIYHG